MSETPTELLPNLEQSAPPQKQEDYSRRLAHYLKDPAFRSIEGFPRGSDQAILDLSDPPYYTACPNPFLSEVLDQWWQEREETRRALGLTEDTYQHKPFAADVAESKRDPIYNAHSYHTKVPHKAIMRYILHYTEPGDIVFDGFCGTGMTGVAAQLCGDKKTVESLGYRVDDNGVIWEGQEPISHLGARKAVLTDLSPAATLIAYNYNAPVNTAAFEREAKRILSEVEAECGWMYETWHPRSDDPRHTKGKINYTVWSDVFVCPNCGREMVFWDVAVDHEKRALHDEWTCPGCGALLSKSPSKKSSALKVDRAWETHFDGELGQSVTQAKQVPVLINYSVGKARFDKIPDAYDLDLIRRINEQDIPDWVPTERMPEGSESRRNDDIGLTHVHQFYTRRNLWALAALQGKVTNSEFFPTWQELLRSCTSYSTKLVKVNIPRLLSGGGLFSFGAVTGTLYAPSLNGERALLDAVHGKIESIRRARIGGETARVCIGTQDSSMLPGMGQYVDYIFVDPPFGGNLMYSELNLLWEAWLRVFTNNHPEAIMNKAQDKGLLEYEDLMEACFQEFYRVLKPGRWITVEFHSTRNDVWNAIQEALQQAGFIVADVSALDKQQHTFKQVTTTVAVKQDLIISAYKPNGNLEQNFSLEAGTEAGVWRFVAYHLGKLHPVTRHGDEIVVNPERQEDALYNRMVAFHVRHGVFIPLDRSQFDAGLNEHFPSCDGMYFLPQQLPEYQEAVRKASKAVQLPLFVHDERTAIQWLRQQLDPEVGGSPKTQGELTNDFNRAMARLKYEQLLELGDILKDNYVQDEEGRWNVPNASKAADLEKMRRQSLLREFKTYIKDNGKLTVFRSEAVRAGFADCYQRKDFATILKVAARLPDEALYGDPIVSMYYHTAVPRKGQQAKS